MNSVFIYCLVVTFCKGAFIEQITPQISTSQMQLDFIYYSQEMEWSAARAVCQSLGGDLAKIDSAELMESLVSIAEDNYNTDIFESDYWVGLVEPNEGHKFWVSDCTSLTYMDNYIKGFDGDKICFKNKQDHTGDRVDCTSTEAFMCQVQSSNRCELASRLTSEVLSVGTNMADCQTLCQDNSNCWATVEYVPDNCVTLAVPGLGVQNLTVRTKFCLNVILNTATVTPDLSNNNIIPDTTCGPFVTTSTSNTSVLTSVSLPQCEPVNVTHYLTLTSTEHTTISTTDYSTLTSTESFTTTEYSTLTTTSTDTSTTTEITTQNISVTSTESITISTTEYSTLTESFTATEHLSFTVHETTTLVTTDTMTETETTTSTESMHINLTLTVTSTVLSTYTQNLTIEQAEDIAAEIAKNLTIDTKSTSSHIRRLTSANDPRQSAQFVGYVGVLFVVLPLAIMLLADLKKLFLDFRSHDHIYKKE